MSKVDWRESGRQPEKMFWDSLSVGQSRVDDLCQPATVRMDVISSNEVREAKVI